MSVRKKILIVEDDPVIVNYLSNFIPLLGEYEVERASNELETLAKINAFDPPLAIVDLHTPKVDGKEILKQIEHKHSKTKLLIIAKDSHEGKTLTNGKTHDVISKPIDLTNLSEKIKRLLPSTEKAKAVSEPARLLIADDEIAISEMLKSDVFEPLGIEVYTACNGEEAFQIFKEKKCNLAIVDLEMPEMNGLDLIKLLEASTNPPKPKAIIIMAAALGDVLDELKPLGYPVLAKPTDVALLEKNVLDACKKYGFAIKK